MSNPTLIVIYDPDGRASCPPQFKHAVMPLADDLSEATIAGYATRLGLLLLEQLAPPTPRLWPMSFPADPTNPGRLLCISRCFAPFGGYLDAAGEVEHTTPLVADANGAFMPVYGPPNSYSVVICSADGTRELWSGEVTLPMVESV